MRMFLLSLCLFLGVATQSYAQVNTDRMMSIARNALYYEDYVLSIQYFNQIISAKSYLVEPYFFRGVAKLNLGDYHGAIEDCSQCVALNPFYIKAYQCRGIAYHNLDSLSLAIDDYAKYLDYQPDDKNILVNKSMILARQKAYPEAEEILNHLAKIDPDNMSHRLMRSNLYLEMGDTLRAMKDVDDLLRCDRYYVSGYMLRGYINYHSGEWARAERDFTKAINLDPVISGNYINRGLSRYKLNNLRGAMADYDKVIDLDDDNLFGRFNRALLRMQVGDDNRAIDDFDQVIALEPDNYHAIYNRALLREKTGDYRGGVEDLTQVLNHYPDFAPALYLRSDLYKLLGNSSLADDLEQAYNKKDKKKLDAIKRQVREEADKDITKYNQLVMFNKKDIDRDRFKSETRGRIQDRAVKIEFNPDYLFTYYEEMTEVVKKVPFTNIQSQLNELGYFSYHLLMTNEKLSLNETQIETHRNEIGRLSALIDDEPLNAYLYFGRAINHMLLHDIANAILDVEKACELMPSDLVMRFQKTVLLTMMLDRTINEEGGEGALLELNSSSEGAQKDVIYIHGIEFDYINKEYQKISSEMPTFAYAYYNAGNLQCMKRDFRSAIEYYSKALRCDEGFSDAYFNRGLAYIQSGDMTKGIEDLSRAGELGIPKVYSIIKRVRESLR